MKKLMIVATVAMAAIASQSAQFTWKTGAVSTTGPVVLPGTVSGSLAEATAYIFADGAQQTVLDSFFTDGTISAGALDGSTMSTAGKIAGKTAEPFTYGGEGVAAHLDAFFAVVQTVGDQKYLFISDIASGDAAATGSKQLSFNATAAGANLTTFGASDTKTYSKVGWYTASVPEPTSGLLMLLGFAGLALRRRRA